MSDPKRASPSKAKAADPAIEGDSQVKQEPGSTATRKRGLGRGLSALFGDAEATYGAAPNETAIGGGQTLPIEALVPGRFQPRRSFDEGAIDRLADSVRERGVLQPLLVRPLPGGAKWEIVAGERRWRAAQRAMLDHVPVVVQQLDDQAALQIGLVENLQRQDLNAIEEAEGYRRLIDEFAHTQERLAQSVGKSRSHVANTLRLLALPEPVKAMVRAGDLSPGHARALLASGDPAGLARKVTEKGLSVREAERLASGIAKSQPSLRLPKDPDTAALEADLTERLGLRVSIDHKGDAGRISIAYASLDQLDELLARLSA